MCAVTCDSHQEVNDECAHLLFAVLYVQTDGIGTAFKITRHVSDEIILEGLLPYMLFLVNDSLPQVRTQALKILSHCLQLVRNNIMSGSDANIFQDFIMSCQLYHGSLKVRRFHMPRILHHWQRQL